MPESTLHLVLRLRGGGWGLVIYIPDGKQLTISCPAENYPISKIYNFVASTYPQIPMRAISLQNKTSILDPKKTLKDYQITHANYEIYALIPDYFFSSQGILKLMKTAGYW